MTGPEFATAHGDSANWMPADFDAEMVLAEIDAYTTPDPAPTNPLTPAA